MLSLGETFLENYGLDLCVGASHRPNLAKVGQMPGAQREPQIKELGLCVACLLLELLDGELAQAFKFLVLHAASSRETILVAIGSLAAARCSASRATVRGTPESSKSTRPGRTTATQNSGLPLPEPILTSAGFFVAGLSGKTLIHTLPPRLMCRVIAIRAASI